MVNYTNFSEVLGIESIRETIWRCEEEERRRIKAIKDSREELSEIIKAWERRAANMEGDQKTAVLKRLALARTMIDSTDALKWLVSWKTPEERQAGLDANGRTIFAPAT